MKLNGLSKEPGLGLKTIQLVLLTMVSALFFLLLSSLITGGDLIRISALKTAQLLQSVGLFVIPPFLLALLWSTQPFTYLRIHSLPTFKSAIFAIAVMITAIPAINLLSELNHAVSFPHFLSFLEKYMMEMEAKAETLTHKMLAVSSIPDLLINIGLIAIIPAVGEELFFRGIIQRMFQDKLKTHMAVWVTAFIFSSIHFQFYGFIPRLLMGAFLGYLYVWTNNLWVPILAHFTNNALAVVFFYLKNTGQTTVDLENIGNSETYLVGMISMVTVAVLIYFFRPKISVSS
jgi:membrane protease YdiL (CAAX protease family)